MTVPSAPGPAQDPAPGISRDLARERAELISNVRYELVFELEKSSDHVDGEVIVYFDLPEVALPEEPVVLDFGGGELSDVVVNGVPQERGVRRVHDHVVVSARNMDPGRNRISARFASPVAPTGTPLSVFRDDAREQEFLYTLVVPADAHRLYPCFDQPDLKAVFDIQVEVPADWVAISNSPTRRPPEDTPTGRKLFWFAETKPLSTYVMAFAAGPFQVLEQAEASNGPDVRILVRGTKLDELEPDWVFGAHVRSLQWLQRYFDYPYPFDKLDIVLVPGFPYGGMEHAGAIFYRESALAFDHAPTRSELLRRSTLVYHEVSHQWFGDLVTMEWFDDLWLKEGFATLISYMVLDALEPESNAWLRFLQRVKPAAYRIDATSGTTPIYQELGNLGDAKSTYGAIVYDKAPAVLKELRAWIGDTAFRNGVQVFLREHEYGNANWEDLMRAFERASGKELSEWSSRWILAPGMPRVRMHWEASDDRVTAMSLTQESTLGDGGTWPLDVEVLRVAPSGRTETVTVSTDDATAPLPDEVGREAPAALLLNPRDVAYGEFLLDPVSRSYWLERVPDMEDPLRRAVVMMELFDAVRNAELAPTRYAELAIELLHTERDPLTHAWLLGTLGTTLRRYLHPADRDLLTRETTRLLMSQLEEGLPGLELQTFRFLARASTDESVLELCEELLAGEDPVPGLEIGRQDRYLALAALLAAGRAGPWPAKMTGAATPVGAEKEAFLALAAAADAETKRRYFETYMRPDDPPEQWMQQSLSYFHWPGQGELTLPYLRPALERVEWVEQHRKIFFMPAWIDAFINAHSNAEALQIVRDFLQAEEDLPIDIRRKILQSLDSLRRAVAIRERWK